MKAYLTTVHLLVRAGGNVEACDAVSGLLTETGIFEGGDMSALVDWSYATNDGRYLHPKAVILPDEYDRDDCNLDALAKKTLKRDLVEDWKIEVASGETLLGFEAWRDSLVTT